MKIKYDVELYKKIANLHLNEIVQVKNRKGHNFAIHITNLTRLSWRELQLLNSSGKDRFSKMVELYNRYSIPRNDSNEVLQNPLSPEEIEEIQRYIGIYKTEGLHAHFQVNEYITANDLWHQFPKIRSLNDHGDFKNIHGIQPKYFQIICHLLNISGGNGRPLDAYRTY
jgi:hypothetical protein